MGRAMTRLMSLALIGATLVAGVAVAAAPPPAAPPPAAPPPAALERTAPGMWEIDGLPGAKVPARQCVSDVVTLARFEHRARNCSHKVLSDGASASLIEYSCGAGNFGRSKLTVITPRSLRIDTQGISDNMPFHYQLQARRVGDCPPQVSAVRH